VTGPPAAPGPAIAGGPLPALPAAAAYLACWSGEDARGRVAALLAAAPPGIPVSTASLPAAWDGQAAGALGALLAGARVGARIILAGPEAVLAPARALALRLGALDDEIVLLPAAPGGPARVYCVTCRGPFAVTASPGAAVTCPGCGAALAVDRRFSPARAAYLGWPAGLDLHQ
jgi:hypothetical protein